MTQFACLSLQFTIPINKSTKTLINLQIVYPLNTPLCYDPDLIFIYTVSIFPI